MTKHFFYVISAFIFALLITFTQISYAQENERFISQAKVIDTINLKAGLREITLWGVRPVKDNTALVHIEAINLLDKHVAKGEVSCKAIAEKFPYMIARCLSTEGIDLGMDLLTKGFVALDRNQIEGSDFANLYEEAENDARKAKRGLWGYLDKKSDTNTINSLIYKYFTDSTILTVAGTVLATVLFIILIAVLMLLRTINIKKDEIEKIHYKEKLLKIKEKSVIISLLKSEMDENRHELQAFISMYKQILENIKHCNSDTEAREKIGKSIKKFPILSRGTFDMHLAKLAFLNLNVVNNISSLYGYFITEEEYIDINETSSKSYIESCLKSSIDKATDVLIKLDKNIHILDLEYVLILDTVNNNEEVSNI